MFLPKTKGKIGSPMRNDLFSHHAIFVFALCCYPIRSQLDKNHFPLTHFYTHNILCFHIYLILVTLNIKLEQFRIDHKRFNSFCINITFISHFSRFGFVYLILNFEVPKRRIKKHTTIIHNNQRGEQTEFAYSAYEI